jgi:hypothetical protein
MVRPRHRKRSASAFFTVGEPEQEAAMDNSVYQARWLLAPVFTLGFAFITLGVFLG